MDVENHSAVSGSRSIGTGVGMEQLCDRGHDRRNEERDSSAEVFS